MKRKDDTHAAVAANISILRALVKIARFPRNTRMNVATDSSRTRIGWTKYSTIVAVTGIMEAKRVIKIPENAKSLESLCFFILGLRTNQTMADGAVEPCYKAVYQPLGENVTFD